ncbi:MAG: GGDEF domain-containing protein, partial [Campylobacteraceae bacterium]|nr:GGDEF domain-containing protein [Campylobacteraceae bacterium]
MSLKVIVVSVITFLLISLSIGTSILNYTKSLNETEKQLKNSSLPLSIDNIYTEIQKNVIEPNLISSMMSSNTFLKDWLINEESNIPKIKKYLSTIKDKYSMFNTFLVSHESKNY